ncbi:MAG: penicillin-binding protein activator, partial [Gammaproteobacteria bacterium]
SNFVDEYESDGDIVASVVYDPTTPDFSTSIRQMLLLDQSINRHKRLASYLGEELEFEPRARGDIDLIFMAANAKTAKLIRPQLRFHYAGNIPTYATSAIFEPGSSNNADLNGLIFPEIPWLLEPGPTATELQETLKTYWGAAATKRARFYAMGYDAYRLMPLLVNQPRAIRGQVQGMTGELWMSNDRRLHRQLLWARIDRGKPKRLPDPQLATPEVVETPLSSN